jgi:hypothetical protein
VVGHLEDLRAQLTREVHEAQDARGERP